MTEIRKIFTGDPWKGKHEKVNKGKNMKADEVYILIVIVIYYIVK